jgi:hypothetical protein
MCKMNDWLAGHDVGRTEGKLVAFEMAAQHFEQNIKGLFNPHQVAIILRALAEIEEKVSPEYQTANMQPFPVCARPVNTASLVPQNK